MLRSTTLTLISSGANGVDLEAEKLARHYGLNVEVVIPTCHPRKGTVQTLNISATGGSDSYYQASRCSPRQADDQSYQLTVYSSKLSCGENQTWY